MKTIWIVEFRWNSRARWCLVESFSTRARAVERERAGQLRAGEYRVVAYVPRAKPAKRRKSRPVAQSGQMA